jgi:diamine N-acetyltransferase
MMRLRAIEPEDLDLLYQIENDQSLWKVGTTNVPYSRYTLHDYIANSSDDIYADRQVRMIVENDEGETVGIVDLVQFSPEHLRAEVGIVILQDHRRKGYAREALRELFDYALRIIHLHQLYAVVDVRNEAAVALFKDMGFLAGNTMQEWLFDGREYHDALLMQRFL